MKLAPSVLAGSVIAVLICDVALSEVIATDVGVLGSQSSLPLCTISADSTCIHARSPLLVQIVLDNSTGAPIPLKKPIADVYGTATIEVRGPDSVDFAELKTRYSGLKDGLGARPPLPPGAKYAAYLLLLCDLHKEWIFPVAGQYELRARVEYDGGTVRSDPITIIVEPNDERTTETLNELRQDVCSLSLEESLPSEQVERLSDALSNIGEYQHALLWAKGTILQLKKDAALYEQGNASLDRLRDSGGTLWGELATVKLAQRQAEHGEIAKAQQMLAKVKHCSILSETTRATITDQEKMAEPKRRDEQKKKP